MDRSKSDYQEIFIDALSPETPGSAPEWTVIELAVPEVKPVEPKIVRKRAPNKVKRTRKKAE